MALMPTLAAERRKFLRRALPARFVVHVVRATQSVAAEGVNFGEGGLCLRLREALDVRSSVQLRFTPARTPAKDGGGTRARAVTCAGRVAWVIQRLDLRDHPPFVFDTGVEFANPPPMLRRLASHDTELAALKQRAAPQRMLEPFLTRGRGFLPRLERSSSRPPRWHLVVSVDGVPCFSAHYPSERAAIAAWAKFKRQQARR